MSPPHDAIAHGRHEDTESSASSSILNPNLPEGMLIQEPDADVETTDADVSGHVESHAGDEESKKNLRDQLRRTLNKKDSRAGEHLSPSA